MVSIIAAISTTTATELPFIGVRASTFFVSWMVAALVVLESASLAPQISATAAIAVIAAKLRSMAPIREPRGTVGVDSETGRSCFISIP